MARMALMEPGRCGTGRSKARRSPLVAAVGLTAAILGLTLGAIVEWLPGSALRRGTRAAEGARRLRTLATPIAAGWRRLRSLPARSVAEEAVPDAPFAYDESLGRTFASLAQVSYCGPMPKLPTWSCGPCLESGTEIVPGSWRGVHHQLFSDELHTFVTLAKFSSPPALAGACLVSIRGTERFTNVQSDLEFWSTTLPPDWNCTGCQVMSGAYNDWIGVESQVVQSLGEIGCGSGSDLVITGHSAGAGDGTLAAMSLTKRLGFRLRYLFSYESPRLGNDAFAAAFDAQVARVWPSFRITHARDPIVHLPFQNWGYRHVLSEVFYDSAGGHTVCHGNEDPQCSLQYSLYSLADHCGTPLVPGGNMCACPGWVPLGHSSMAVV